MLRVLKLQRMRRLNCFLLALLFTGPFAARADVAVLTEHNNLSHTGANLEETTLTTENVNTNTFGLLYTRPVDDQIYAQPLIMTNVNIPGQGVHNIVIVATVNDTIYTFDADDPTVEAPYWTRSFINPPAIVPPNRLDFNAIGACGGNYQDFTGNIGIVSTPVIDPATGTIYLIARTKEPGNTFVQRLHALDIQTGEERPNSPVVINATYPGTGAGSAGDVITFDPEREAQRAALVLVNGVVYIAWASHCDLGPYHGWIMGYDSTNLQQVVVYNDTPDGSDGGIWMSGEGISADSSGNLYVGVGNGSVGTRENPRDTINRGESFLKLVRNGSNLRVASWFTPYNYQQLERGDTDLSGAGLILIPGTTLTFSGGKQGIGYLVDYEHMGGLSYSGADTNIPQSFAVSPYHIHGGMVWWDGPTGSFGYISPCATSLQQYKFDRSINRFVLPAFARSSTSTPGGEPGGILALSANGSNAVSGILWASHQLNGDANHTTLPGILHAYDARNVSHELWNSEQISARDAVGDCAKFVPPTVANGKVYLATFSGRLDVYGLASGWVSPPTITPGGVAFTNSATVTLSDAMPGASVYYTLDGSTPTTRSELYTGPFVLTNATLVTAKGIKTGFADSAVSSAMFVNNALLGSGTGLTGAYYSNQAKTFNDPPTLTRTDATVNFDWGHEPPASGISQEHFTVRWTGAVQSILGGTYTFYATTDDGVRLWINDRLIIDNWYDQSPSEASGSITLVGQQRYNLRMEYYQETAGAQASLSWSTPTMEKSIIPQTQLYATNTLPPAVALTEPADGATYTARASVTMAATAATDFNALGRITFYTNNVFFARVTNDVAMRSNVVSLTATGLAAGSYELKAVAWDLSGLARTSAPVTITVNPASGEPYGLTMRERVSPFLHLPRSLLGAMPEHLSATGVFTNMQTMGAAPGLIPYSLNTPRWDDGAIKTRYFAIPGRAAPYPPEQQIAFAPTGGWKFPAGSVFVQTFELITNDANPALTRRLETRLLVRSTNGAVYGLTYKWRPDNSDADLLSDSLSEDIPIVTATGTRTQTWYYPSQSDCFFCHSPAANFVLGLKTGQLNGNFRYPSSGTVDNQLRTLNRLGLLNPAIDEAGISNDTRFASLTNSSASLEERFRSYMDANCAECHRPGASGVTTDCRYETPLARQNLINTPASRGNFGYDNARIIVPGDVQKSILWDRMNTTNPVVKMPSLARNLVDSNAVQLTADWIKSLPGAAASLRQP